MTMSWSGLPADLVAVIADKITDHADFACFRSVCPSWRSASATHAARRRVPLLLLPAEYRSRVKRHLWSFADDTIADISMPAAHGFLLFASPNGWTLGVKLYFSAALLHPFAGAYASLPGLPTSFRDYSIVRCDMVWDRSPDGTVMIGRRPKKPCSSAVFFCRPGDESWRQVECAKEISQVSSITYSDGAFYLFDGETRRTVGVDCETFAVATVIEPPPVALIMPDVDEHLLPRNRPKAESTLVVSSAEEFLMIVRTHQSGGSHGDRGGEVLIQAFRWHRRSWAVVDDIGDRAVFVDSFRGFFSVLNLAGLTTERLPLGNLSKHRCDRF